jgi:hypothetical protein
LTLLLIPSNSARMDGEMTMVDYPTRIPQQGTREVDDWFNPTFIGDTVPLEERFAGSHDAQIRLHAEPHPRGSRRQERRRANHR